MRRRNFITLLLICFLPVLFVVVPSQAAGLAPELQAALSSLRDLDEISVILTLSEKADIRQMKGRDKRLLRSTMIRTLKEKASVTQRPIKDFLELKGARKIRPLWLINGIAVTAPAAVIHELIDFPGVEEIRLDETILAPVVDQEVSAIPEWNLSAIRVPELWAFGYTGQGVVVANMDTGVDVNHPDLQSRWRGGTNSWFDPNGRHSTPFDANGHGTSTMGVMVGGDAGGTAIGVAPGARWIAVKIFNDSGRATLSRIHEGFQWLLDPDDNPDIDDAPDVVNNSWGLDNINGCSLEFEPDIQALKAAGIAVVFAGGNSGPNLFTSISPANNPGAFAVGSVSQSLDIAFTSSRGPSACGDDIYPEVVAPGVSIRTADLFNLYMTGSGTSFAAPHVAGAMALLLSAFPTLTVSELESALQQSAFDLGVPGPDNSYGYGLLDVLAAYQLLFDSAPDIFADPSSYEFTKTKEGSFSLPKTFTVINRGTEDLSIFDIAITGTHFTEFLKQSDECSGQILAPSEVCILEIVFSPTSGGIKRADLLISSNDPDDNSLSITLIGTGKEQYKLDVATTGTGTGRVVSKSKKIDCGLDCSELYSPGRVVTLEAVADPESKFEGWSVCSSSGCGSSVGTTRMVRMSTDKNVTATFIGPSLTLTAPNGGETWRKGTSKRIKWTFTGRPGLYVKIELLQGETAIRTIAKQAPKGSYGKGHFDWFISEKLPDGADYKIRITSTRNSAHTDTSEDFLAITP